MKIKQSNPIAISSQKSRWAYCLFVLPCWSLAVQNVGAFTMLVFTKYQRMYFHALTEKWPTSYFMCIWSWQSTPFMYLLYSWMLLWLIYLDHIMTQSPVCVNNISWVWICTWQVLQFYCLAKQWPPSLSCHPGMICKHHRSFYQVYEYPLEDTSYSLILSHCSMFYKPASPSVTEQM